MKLASRCPTQIFSSIFLFFTQTFIFLKFQKAFSPFIQNLFSQKFNQKIICGLFQSYRFPLLLSNKSQNQNPCYPQAKSVFFIFNVKICLSFIINKFLINQTIKASNKQMSDSLIRELLGQIEQTSNIVYPTCNLSGQMRQIVDEQVPIGGSQSSTTLNFYEASYEATSDWLYSQHQLQTDTQIHEETSQSESKVNNQIFNEISNLRRKNSSRSHLYNSRKKRGQVNKLQKTVNGYWTKNFLPIGKNAHFSWIEKKMGLSYIKQNSELLEIMKKNGIKMEDYVYLYSIKDLKKVWDQFFVKQVMYREIMISRALPKNRLIFIGLACRFKQAYLSGQFDHIA